MTSFFRNMKVRHRENIVKDALTKELNDAVKDVQINKKLVENDLYETSENSAKNLMTVLEAIFIHGVRDTIGDRLAAAVGDPDRRPTPEFWSPMMIFTHKHLIEQVNRCACIANDVGRSRCWLRMSLNEGNFLSYLFSISQETKALKPYYKNIALLLDTDRLGIVISYLQGIAQFKFTFPTNSTILNYWSDETLLLVGLWMGGKELPVSSGMDVALGLPDEDSDGGSVKSLSSGVILNEEEVLKRILSTPTEGSPLQRKLDDEDLLESNARSSPSLPIMSDSDSPVQTEDSSDPERPEATEPEILQSSSNPSELESPLPPPDDTLESYDQVLDNYFPGLPLLPETELDKFVASYPAPEPPTVSTPKKVLRQSSSDVPVEQEPFEIIEKPLSNFKRLVELIISGKIVYEPGLDLQSFSCKDCNGAIGISSTPARVCALSGFYYCVDCFKNYEFVIPGRIVRNWDFAKYPVSPQSHEFLSASIKHPLINLRSTNPRLYYAVEEMEALRKQREKLNLLKPYLFTCHDSSKDRLLAMFWPREYLYEHVHLYSVQDFIEAAEGTLSLLLRKGIRLAEDHVKSCVLCAQKGFFCELCRGISNNPKPIFPFDVDNVTRCTQCRSIYHRDCVKNAEDGCPKCLRIEERRKQKAEGSASVEN